MSSALSKTETLHQPWFFATRTSVFSILLVLLVGLTIPGCSFIKGTANVVSGTVKGTVWVIKGAYELTVGTTKIIYQVGKFTFEVVRAPLDWSLTNDDLETIDGLPVKEAIRQGRVKAAPYTVKGRRYVPMNVAKAQTYKENRGSLMVRCRNTTPERRSYDSQWRGL